MIRPRSITAEREAKLRREERRGLVQAGIAILSGLTVYVLALLKLLPL